MSQWSSGDALFHGGWICMVSFASVLDFDFPFLSRRVSFKRSILYIYKFDEKNTREGETRKRKGSNSQFVENVFGRKCKLWSSKKRRKKRKEKRNSSFWGDLRKITERSSRSIPWIIPRRYFLPIVRGNDVQDPKWKDEYVRTQFHSFPSFFFSFFFFFGFLATGPKIVVCITSA